MENILYEAIGVSPDHNDLIWWSPSTPHAEDGKDFLTQRCKTMKENNTQTKGIEEVCCYRLTLIAALQFLRTDYRSDPPLKYTRRGKQLSKTTLIYAN